MFLYIITTIIETNYKKEYKEIMKHKRIKNQDDRFNILKNKN